MATKNPTLGSIIRKIRADRGWTLAEMSRHVDIPVSTLTKVEHDRLTLTYDKLAGLGERLGMRLSDLLNVIDPSSATSANARRSASHSATTIAVSTPNYDYEYLCTELRSKMMIPILSKVKAKSIEEFGPLTRHEGEEFLFILSGAVEVYTEFYEVTLLNAGDYLYIDSEMAHGYVVAEGHEEAMMLTVCSSRNEDLQRELISRAASTAASLDRIVGRTEQEPASRSRRRNSAANAR